MFHDSNPRNKMGGNIPQHNKKARNKTKFSVITLLFNILFEALAEAIQQEKGQNRKRTNQIITIYR